MSLCLWPDRQREKLQVSDLHRAQRGNIYKARNMQYAVVGTVPLIR